MSEPNDDDEVLAESLIATYGCAVSKPLNSRVRLGGHPGEETSRLFAEALATRREEIEDKAIQAERERRVKDMEAFVREGVKDAIAQAKRAGAREALKQVEKHEDGCSYDGHQCYCPCAEPLVEALKAARQFLQPEVMRGPSSAGWVNTVELVRVALAAHEERTLPQPQAEPVTGREVELDSPPSTPPELAEFRARGFERINRHRR